ncbi:MAG: phosphonate ABC transporter, permease protein PhnE [Anaerolineae bacterium]|nr:phosphonate ABC transporter, permease protein PhnE [Anaerolineae bacterium]
MKILRWLIIGVLAVLAYAYAIRVTEPDPVRLFTSLPKAADVVGQLLSPDILIRSSTSYTLSMAFPVPCGSAPNAAPTTDNRRISAQPQCAAVGEPIVFLGQNLGANAEVAVRWGLPNGNRLPLQVLRTDANGNFRYETTARPITAARDGQAATLDAVVSVPGNQWELSHTVYEVIDQLFVTVFIALLATTIASVVAAPLSFLAARNLTQGPFGKVVYTLTRSLFNITRAFEPLVLATVFALIVGFGKPFAGVLGIIIGTIASLGKMFSEAVEDIDMGAVEAVTATGATRAQVVSQAVVPQIIPNWLAYMLYHWDINVRISTIIGFVGAGGIGEFLQKQIDTLSYRQAGTALLGIILVVWTLDFISAQVRKRLI